MHNEVTKEVTKVCMLILLIAVVGCSRGVRVELDDGGYSPVTGFDSGGGEFFLKSPSGWASDSDSGKKLGLPVVFYPKGESFDYAPAVIYTGSMQKAGITFKTFEELVKDDVTKFHKEHPNLRTKRIKDLITGDKKPVVVMSFIGAKEGVQSHEAVAYINEPGVVVMLALSARSERAYNDAFVSFEKLVGSYSFASSNQ